MYNSRCSKTGLGICLHVTHTDNDSQVIKPPGGGKNESEEETTRGSLTGQRLLDSDNEEGRSAEGLLSWGAGSARLRGFFQSTGFIACHLDISVRAQDASEPVAGLY